MRMEKPRFFFRNCLQFSCHSAWVCQYKVNGNDDEDVSCLNFGVCDCGCHDDSNNENRDDNIFIDSDDDYMCDNVQEYQQVQVAEDLCVNSDSSVCEASDDGSVLNDAGGGNLDNVSETEWMNGRMHKWMDD